MSKPYPFFLLLSTACLPEAKEDDEPTLIEKAKATAEKLKKFKEEAMG